MVTVDIIHEESFAASASPVPNKSHIEDGLTSGDSGCESSSLENSPSSSRRPTRPSTPTDTAQEISLYSVVGPTTITPTLPDVASTAHLLDEVTDENLPPTPKQSNKHITKTQCEAIEATTNITNLIKSTESTNGFDNLSLDFEDISITQRCPEKWEIQEKSEKSESDDSGFDPIEFKVGGSRKTEGKLAPQVLAALALAIAAMIEGYSSGYTSPALASMSQNDSHIQITEHESSWVGSLMPLTALLGGVIGGTLIDKVGRKATIMATAIPYIISWLFIAFAHNLPMVYAGRAIQGFCVGLTTLCLPVFLSEAVQPEWRGTLGLLPTTVGNTGILMCYVLGSYLDWQILAALGACLPVPFLVCMWFVPETPRWYVSKHRHEEARVALQWLRGTGTDVRQELADIQQSYAKSSQTEAKLKDLFQMKYLRPLMISLGLMFFQQMSGVNAIIFYTVSIFEKSGGSIDSNLSAIIVGLANFFATLGSNLVIDRVGRKILLNLSGFFMGLSLTVLGIFFYLQMNEHDLSNFGWLPLATFMVYIIAFSVGYGPIPWLMMGEIFPSQVRGPAASFATAFNWTCSFAVTKSFTDILDGLGTHGAFYFFGAICLSSVAFVTLFVPETKGHSLEDIETRMMEKRVRKKDRLADLKNVMITKL